MTHQSTRIRALLLLFVIITGLMMSFGENILCAGELPVGHDCPGASSPAHDETLIHDSACPSAPSSDHSTGDHFCCGNCNGPCHAPLSSVSVVFACTPVGIPLSYSDRNQFIPEVYLSKFIPPQLHA